MVCSITIVIFINFQRYGAYLADLVGLNSIALEKDDHIG